MRAWLSPLLCAGCATGAPVHLPRTALPTSAAVAQLDGVDIHVETVNEGSWTEHPGLKARLIWNEPAMLWGKDVPGHRDVVVPLVPLPSFEVTIENRTGETLSLADAEVVV